MKDTMEKLKKAMMEVGEKVYKEADGASTPGDDVIETDFSAEK